MAVTVDAGFRKRALSNLLQALAIADGDAQVSEDWIDRIRLLSLSERKTFIPLVGTALLARTVDAAIDPFALQTKTTAAPGLQSYSARSLATKVLADVMQSERISLGVTGKWPLNNSPFFKMPDVHSALAQTPGIPREDQHLRDCLASISKMSSADALSALAAFLRVRREATREFLDVELGALRMTFQEIVGIATNYVSEDMEGGRRGQALVAAAMDMVWETVVSEKINSPSRHVPGDVVAYGSDEQAGVIITSFEVKQPPVKQSEVTNFAANLSTRQIGRGAYAALSPRQPALDRDQVRTLEDRYGVFMSLYESPAELLEAALTWSRLTTEDFVATFPIRFLARLTELESSVDGRHRWASFFEEASEPPTDTADA